MSHPHSSLRRRSRRAAACAVVAICGVGVTVTADAARSPLVDAEAALSEATAVRIEAEDRLAALELEQQRLEAQMASLSGDSASIADALAAARAQARISAIQAYTNAGTADRLSAMLHSAAPSDASIRTVILTAGVHDASDAAAAWARLKQENDPELVALAERIDALHREIDSAWSDVAQASALESDAELRVVAARRARDAEAALARAAASSTTTTAPATPALAVAAPPPPAAPRGRSATDDQWARLRECESGGNYQAVSISGRYRGAYQFSRATWESVGGVGDPAAAPAWEQDLRARILFETRGSRAWPHCGRHLR